MWKKDHERIAEVVASNNHQYFKPDTLRELKQGSIYPDSINRRIAHHQNREKDIMFNILTARKLFLQNKQTESAFHMGIAFHFIADGTCPGAKNPKHNAWEREISQLLIPRYLLPKIGTTPNNLFHEINEELEEPKRTAKSSFETTIRLCSEVPSVVWKSTDDITVQDKKLINEARKQLPDKLSYYASLVLVFVALGLGAMKFASSLDTFQMLLVLTLIYFVSSIPFKQLNKKKHAVFWIIEWYGMRY
jgi:hypothetical protein